MVFKNPTPDAISFLLRRRFPPSKYALVEGKVLLVETPDATLDLLDSIDAYETDLRKLSPDERDNLVREETIKSENAPIQSKVFGFAGPVADFNYWSRASYWTVEEAVALALGRNPELVKLANMAPGYRTSSFAKRYIDLHELVLRAIWAKQLWEPSYPTIFLAWAKRMDISVVPELIEAVEARGLQIADWKTLHDDLQKLLEEKDRKNAELFTNQEQTYSDLLKEQAEQYSALLDQQRQNHEAQLVAQEKAIRSVLEKQNAENPAPSREPSFATRERESLLKLVIGMAVEGYRFNPRASKNTATAEIASDLAKVGVPLDADTVRKWLREAIELLPPKTE